MQTPAPAVFSIQTDKRKTPVTPVGVRVVVDFLFLLPLGIKIGVGEWASIPTGSMQPTLLAGDWIWYEKYSYGAVLPTRLSELPFVNLLCIFPSIERLDQKTCWKEYRLKGFRKPEREDIVVFRSPKGENELYVKRCMALPGDTIAIRRGRVYINGVKMEEEKGRVNFWQSSPTTFPVSMKEAWTTVNYGPLEAV